MEFVSKHKWKLLAVGVSLLALGFYFDKANAADLGGTCCSDLEERIADLESSTARKGTKAVSVTIYGTVNKGLFYYDVDDVNVSDTAVIENSASETFFGVTGKAQINKDWAVGYVLEVGQGKTGVTLDLLTGDAGVGTDNDLYTRQSYAFADTPVGKVSVGLRSMATDDWTTPSLANTDAATKRLTLQPIGGLIVSAGPISLLSLEVEPFNGHKADSLRWDSHVFAGFSASAAWESNGDSWDAQLRYAAEVAGFQVLASVGYEDDKADDLLGLFGNLETKTTMVNAGVKHVATGLFAQGSWARLEIDPVGVETDAFHVQGGLEGRWSSLGVTTVWGGYANWDDLDLTTYELGLNQNINGAVDAYLLGKTYELGDVDARSLLGGVRVKF